MCAILSPETFFAMIKCFILQICVCLFLSSNVLCSVPSQENVVHVESENVLEISRNFSNSQLFIKVVKGFDFELSEEQDISAYLDVQKMLFELHKLVRESEIISVKRPAIQLTSYNSNIYVFEFEEVNDLNALLQQVQSLYFIESARKVPTH